MVTFLTLLPLRFKLLAITVAGVLASLGYFWIRYRIAASRAASATAKADALEAARKAEVRIADRRGELREKTRLVREQIEAGKARDYFEGGWGP
jgi:hypothetical protein